MEKFTTAEVLMEEAYKGSLAELRPKLRESLPNLSYEVQDEIITLLKSEIEKIPPPTKESDHRHVNQSLNERDTYYAVKNSDLQLLKESVAVAAAIPVLGGAVSLIGGLVVLLFQYRKKRVRLNEKEGVVLKTLKRATIPGWTVKVLAANLPIKPWLEEAEIQAILVKLKSIINENGEEVALVAEKEGVWRTIDV